MVTTVDHVSGGRAELGLGMGWFEGEHRAAGIPFPPVRERAGMFAEAIEIIHRQWTEDEFDFHGRHYELEGCRALPKPVQKPAPPIIVGGFGEARDARARRSLRGRVQHASPRRRSRASGAR